jgi:hypothetical protein
VRTVLVLVALWRAALAEPADAAFEVCKARRSAEMLEAMKIASTRERADRLLAIAECVPPTPRTSVVETKPQLAQPATGPSLAVTVGTRAVKIAFSSSDMVAAAPIVIAETAYRFARGRYSLGVFASFATLSVPVPGYILVQQTFVQYRYQAPHTQIDVGARARLHFGRANAFVECAMERDDAAAFADVAGFATRRVGFGGGAGYELASSRHVAMELEAALAYAFTLAADPADRWGDAFSARLSLGVRLLP